MASARAEASFASPPSQAALVECERQMHHDWAELVCHAGFAASGKKKNKLDEGFKHQAILPWLLRSSSSRSPSTLLAFLLN